MTIWPITLEQARESSRRIRPYIRPSPHFTHPLLDAAVGEGIRLVVKHENFLPTGSFKVRNATSFMTGLSPADQHRGVAAASRGNYGLGLAWAGHRLGIKTTIFVPRGNVAAKNQAMAAYGAEVRIIGADYDEALRACVVFCDRNDMTLSHSTNDASVLAGAATLSLELVEDEPSLDAIVVSIGGGSHAVGAIVVTRALSPHTRVIGVQAAGASAVRQSWIARKPLQTETALTFADGLATRMPYELTFPALCEGLADFVTVSEDEIADACRLILRTTHSLVEGAGAAGLAGLIKLRSELAGRKVAVVLSGGNLDLQTLAVLANCATPTP